MLHVTPELFALANSGNPEDLKAALQHAIALEHATMPPYLYALYSLGGENSEISKVLRTIAQEEMLHMLLAGNLLKAIGGRPVIHSAEFVRAYPGPLPGIASDFDVPLKRFSLELARDVFMRIEEPDKPIPFPVHAPAALGSQPRTIGEFYRQIRKVFRDQPNLIQVKTGQPTEPQFADYPVKQTIESSADAMAAIDFIVGQGEGTDTDPFFRDGDNIPDNDSLAHYYRFAEIVRGRLKKNLTPPPNPKPEDLYFYDSADLVSFNAGAVLPLRDNPRRADFPQGSEARRRLDEFNRAYTEVLRALDDAFNVDPTRLDDAVGLMRPGLRSAALALTSFDLGDGTRLGPSFEFV